MVLDVFLNAFRQVEAYFLGIATALLGAYGGFGVLIGMFLESSIVPIPSEAVLVTAGLIGIPPLTVAIYGSTGSTLGAIVGYYIGKKGGRPVVDAIGPYLFVTRERVGQAEKKFSEWGAWTVFVSRLVPFIPYKVFSITSGILRFDFKNFVFFTFLGSVPRCFLLAWVGLQIMQYRETALVIIAALLAIGAWYWVWKKIFVKRDDKQQRIQSF